MADNSYSRHWEGVNDPVHPLSRTAHSAISHGRYIYVLNGYGPSDNKMVLFDQIGLTRYDILTNCVEFLPIHWMQIITVSYVHAVINAESVSTNDEPACIYTFGGYSILGNIHVNALCRIELTHHNLPKYTTSDHQNQSGKVTSTGLRSHCCHASVVSGHGILSCLSYLPQDNALHESISLTMLKSFQRQLEYHHPANIHNRFDSIHDNVSHNCHHLLPSPRDKLCMEYWRGRLYVFGGYGPSFMPYSTWPKQIFHWPYLHDPNDETNWIICDSNGGWNSQLIIYDISENRWELVTRLDAIGRFQHHVQHTVLHYCLIMVG
ncbi:unnamed protein product [Heterobilharzia americana]|nr:unnamed protein product [Heterobilharzia americana]